MLGTRIQDVVVGRPKLIWLSDYCLLLLTHVGTNDTTRGNLDSTRSDYKALGVALKGMGAQVVFSSISLVRRKALLGQVNN